METLSVIIPVYNSREHLEECVASVIAVNEYCGTAFVREIILIDDGSTDGSSALCDIIAERLGSRNCEIRVIHQENSGVSAARNTGLREATGAYVLFADSDDTVDSEKLAELLQTLPTDTSVDMVFFGLTFDYYSGDRIYRQDTMLPPFEGEKSLDKCDDRLLELYGSNMLSPLWNKLIRKAVIDDNLLREDMFLYEDLEFSLRAMARCKTFYFCAQPIYRYRQPQDEGNAGRRLKRIAHITDIVDKIEDALEAFESADEILMSLYTVLAREKIGCASRKETDVICADFREWIDAHGLIDRIQNNGYAMLLYNKQSRTLLFKRGKAKFRHSIANALKKAVGDFRKW